MSLQLFIVFVYPLSLGVDEGLADLLIKGWSSMLQTCGDDCGAKCSNCSSGDAWILWVFIALWCVTAFGSALFFMPIVFRRLETTIALPIEYGTVSVVNVASGLIFYGEWAYFSAWQRALVLVGCALTVVGILLGLLNRTEETEVNRTTGNSDPRASFAVGFGALRASLGPGNQGGQNKTGQQEEFELRNAIAGYELSSNGEKNTTIQDKDSAVFVSVPPTESGEGDQSSALPDAWPADIDRPA